MSEMTTQPPPPEMTGATNPRDFAAVVNRFAGPVLASALRQLGDRQLAEDATQAVFLAFYQAKHPLQSEAHLAGFLFQSTRYVCQNIRRTRGRQDRRDMNYAQTKAAGQSGLDPHLSNALDDAIAALGKEDREVVLRRYFEGRSSVELAEALQLPEATVRKRLSRAVEKLREHLAGAGVVTASGTVASALAVTLPGVGIGSERVAHGLLMAAGSSSRTAIVLSPAAKGAFLAGPKVIITTLCGVSVVGLITAGIALGTARSNSTGHTETTPVATPATTLPAVAEPTPAESQQLADKGDYSGAMRAYVRELAAMSADSYRDKKDFAWIQRVAAEKGAPADALKQAAATLLQDDTRNSALVDWRAHRLLAGLAKTSGDIAAQKTELELAIDTYPAEAYTDPARYSSLQHLYNELGGLIADEKGMQAGLDYLKDAYAKDPKFVFVFIYPWEQRAKTDADRVALANFAQQTKPKRAPAAMPH